MAGAMQETMPRAGAVLVCAPREADALGWEVPHPTEGLSMRIALSVLALLANVAVAAAAPSDDEIRQKIVGDWGQSVTCVEGRLTFKADGTFISRGAGDSYAIQDGRLTGSNGDSDMPTMMVDFDGDQMLLDDGGGTPQRLSRCPAAQ
jgi:hypothetical protein